MAQPALEPGDRALGIRRQTPVHRERARLPSGRVMTLWSQVGAPVVFFTLLLSLGLDVVNARRDVVDTSRNFYGVVRIT